MQTDDDYKDLGTVAALQQYVSQHGWAALYKGRDKVQWECIANIAGVRLLTYSERLRSYSHALLC